MPSFDAKRFGSWLRGKREAARYSVTELAELSGMSKQYLSRIERGEEQLLTNKPTQPALDKVERLARALKIDVAEARDMAGYTAHDGNIEKPQNVAEFVTRLEEMGFDFYGFDQDDAAELGPDDLQDLMEDIEAKILSKTRRRKREAAAR